MWTRRSTLKNSQTTANSTGLNIWTLRLIPTREKCFGSVVVRASERTGPDRIGILVTWDSRRYMFIKNLTSPFLSSCHLFLPLRSKFASNGTAGLKLLKRKLSLKNLDLQFWRKTLFFHSLAGVKYSKSVHVKIYYEWVQTKTKYKQNLLHKTNKT